MPGDHKPLNEGRENLHLEDEMSLSEFLFSIKAGVRYLFSHWITVGACIILGVASMILWNGQKEIQFQSELSFMLSDDGSVQGSGFNSVLSQFGLPANPGKYNIDKLLEISKSRSLIQSVLFEKIDLDGKEDFIANHIIRLYSFHDKWMKANPSFSDFLFSHGRFDQFGNLENDALKRIYRLVVGPPDRPNDGLLNVDYGRLHYIMYFRMKSINEDLSIGFVNILFDRVKAYYVMKAIEKQRSTIQILQSKRDSIRDTLSRVDYDLATIKDRSLGEFRNQSSLRESELSTQSLILKTALAKTEENLAIARFTLENNTPLIQLIDSPIAPLTPLRPSLWRAVIFGFIIGSLFFIAIQFCKFLLE